MKTRCSRFIRVASTAVVALASVALLVAALGDHLTLAADDPVQAALEKARAAGTYRYVADTERTQKAVDSPDEHQSVHVEGKALLPDRSRARAWAGGGSVATGEGALDLIVVGDQVWVYVEGKWQQVETDQLGLSGFTAGTLALLEVADNPTFLRREGSLEVYGFQVEGPRLAAYWQRMLDEQLRDELPQEVEVRLPPALRSARGAGELWIDPVSGYPVRQTLDLEFPDLGDGSSLHQNLDVAYSDFGADLPPIESPASNPKSQTSSLQSPASLSPRTDSPSVVILLSMLLVAGIFRLGQKRAYLLLALFVSGSLVLTPPLQGVAHAQAIEAYAARRADLYTGPPSLEEAMFAGDLTPADYAAALEEIVPRSSAHLLPGSSASVSCTVSESNPDSDGDGLPDECERALGTDYNSDDTDGDGLTDDYEIEHDLNPLSGDTNLDGMSDLLEVNPYSAESLPSDPDSVDTDGDSTPNAWDEDNDGDGVPDDFDLSPFVRSNSYTGEDPFNYHVRLPDDPGPLYVDVQIRPTNADHLRLMYHAFNWPSDWSGNIQDCDGSQDDITLIPMLEVTAPSPDQTPPSGSISNYGMQVRADGSMYVPLSLVEDGGRAVAFSARIFYPAETDSFSPGTGEIPQVGGDVRLVWLVRATVDSVEDEYYLTCGDSTNTIVARYYDDFLVTGFEVEENGGSRGALLWDEENPEGLGDPYYAFPGLASTWMLDADVTLDDVPDLLDSWRLTTTQMVTSTASHPDELLAYVTMTQTKQVLDTLADGVTATLVIAVEDVSRGINLGEVHTETVTFDDATLDLSMVDEPAVTVRSMRLAWFNSTTDETVPVTEILAMTADWADDPDSDPTDLALWRAMLLAWSNGVSQVVQIGEVKVPYEKPDLSGDTFYEVIRDVRDVTKAAKQLKQIKTAYKEYVKFAFGTKKTAEGLTKEVGTWSRLKAGGKLVAGSIFLFLKIMNSLWWQDEEIGYYLDMAGAIYKVVDTAKKIYDTYKAVKGAAEGTWSAMKSAMAMSKAAKILAVVGLVIELIMIWYMFYMMADAAGWSGVAFVYAYVLAVVYTVIAIVLFALMFIPVIGPLIVAIYLLLDFFFGIGDAVAKAITDFLTKVEWCTEIPEHDAIVFGDFSNTLYYGDRGMVEGNTLELSVPITTTVHKTSEGSSRQIEHSRLALQLIISDTYYDDYVGTLYDTRRNPYGPSDCQMQGSNKVCVEDEWFKITFLQPGDDVPVPLATNVDYILAYKECIRKFLPWPHWECADRWEEGRVVADLGWMYFDVLPDTLDDLLAWDVVNWLSGSDEDNDGLDYYEDPCPENWDCDGDLLSDSYEVRRGTDPQSADTDGDGLNDRLELRYRTNPTKPDTDFDGLPDGQEWVRWEGGQVTGAWTFEVDSTDYRAWPDPVASDADDDGLLDSDEKDQSTNPNGLDPVAVRKEADPFGPVRAGWHITYTLVYSNRTATLFSGGVITDHVPDELVGVNTVSEGDLTQTGSDPLAWAMSSMGRGQGVVVTVTAQVDPSISVSGRFTNVAEIAGSYGGEAYQTESRYATVIDMDVPTSTVESPQTGAYLSRNVVATPTVQGLAADPTTRVELVEVSTDGGSSWEDATGSDNWHYAWALPTTDGVYTVRSRATDQVDWMESPDEWATVTVDSTPPTVTLDDPTDGEAILPPMETITDAWGVAVPTPFITITGTSDDNLAGVDYVEIYVDAWDPITVTGAADWSRRVYFYPSRYEGPYVLHTRAVDRAGNWSDHTAPITITLDSTPPGAWFDEAYDFPDGYPPYESPVITTTPAIITGSTTDPWPVGGRWPEADRAGVANVYLSDGGAWEEATLGTQGAVSTTWVYTWNLSGPDDIYSLTVRAVDRAGNDMGNGPVTYLYADINPPTSTITSLSNGQTVNEPVLLVEGTVDDGAGTGAVKVELSDDGGSNWSEAILGDIPCSWCEWWFPWTPGGDGAYTLTVRATDQVGHVEAAHSITVTVDRSGPVAVFANLSDGDVITTPYVITGSAASASASPVITVALSFDGGFTYDQYAEVVTGTQATWAYTWTTGGIVDEHPWAMAVHAWNDLGTEQFVTQTQFITVTVDNTGPGLSVPSDWPANIVGANNVITTAADIVISGTVGDGIGAGVATVEVQTDTGQTWQPATVVSDTWTYTWTVGMVDYVSYTLRARALDWAGNVTSATLPSNGLWQPTWVDNVTPYAPVTWTSNLATDYWHNISSPSLVVTYTGAHDGSGITQYDVLWSEQPDSEPNGSGLTGGTTSSHTASDGHRRWAHVQAQDYAGNWSTIVHYGPFLYDDDLTWSSADVDGSISWSDNDVNGEEWIADSELLDADVRPYYDKGFDLQHLFATWEQDALLLAWYGMAPSAQGDLFFYLDSPAGGTTTTLNYSGTHALPSNFLADYAFVVESEGVGGWWVYTDSQWMTGTTSVNTTFVASSEGAELRIARADLNDTGLVKLVAFAQEEHSGDVWSVFPTTNLLDDDWSEEYALQVANDNASPNEDQPRANAFAVELEARPQFPVTGTEVVTYVALYRNDHVISATNGLVTYTLHSLLVGAEFRGDCLPGIGDQCAFADGGSNPDGTSWVSVRLPDYVLGGMTGTITMTANVILGGTPPTQTLPLTVTADIGEATDQTRGDNLATAVVYLDREPPEVALGWTGGIGPPPLLLRAVQQESGQRWVGAGQHTFSGSAFDDLAGVASVEVKIDDGSWVEASGESGWSYTWDVTGSHLSGHTLYARAADRVNNVSAAASITFTLDLISPTATITNVTDPLWITENTFVLRGTAQDNGSGVDEVEIKAGGLLWDTAEGTTAWEYEWTVPSTGTYTISVRARDVSGNYGPASTQQTEVRLDTDTAGPTIITPTFPVSITTDQSLTVTAAISDGLSGGNGVASATLSYGYISPYAEAQVTGTGPGGNGDGVWRFVVPSQGASHGDDTLKFSITAWDGDVNPSSTTDDNGGSYYAVQVSLSWEHVYLPMVLRNQGTVSAPTRRLYLPVVLQGY